MKGDTHRAGAMALTDTLRLPLSIMYLAVRPNFAEVILYYTIYDTLTLKSTRIGAVLPDYDQAAWQYSPNELHEPIGKFYWKFLRRVNASHRSTHTHNIDIWTILLGIPSFVLYGMYISRLNPIYMVGGTYIFTLYTSILSHQFLDTLTQQGTFQSHLKTMLNKNQRNRKRTSIVPINKTFYDMRHIYWKGIKTPFFRPMITKTGDGEWGKTGGEWENSILYKIAMYLDSRIKLRVVVIEIITLYLISKVL